MSDAEQRLRGLHYALESDPATYVNEGIFSTSADGAHGSDAGMAALATHAHFFPGLAAEEDDGEEENPNDVLLRLLNEVRAVDSDDEDDSAPEAIDRSSDDAAAAAGGGGGAVFSVTDNSGPKCFAVPYSGVVSTAAAGGFTVEGNASYSSLAGMPPPPPPPPAYGTPSTAPRSPFVNCYSGIPHLTATPGSTKPPPPTFAEAMSTSHGTPASLPGGRPSLSQERSPVMANYVPPMPAAAQEPVLLRNCNGVFLLQPSTKPTPPYTPPAGCNSPPVSPLPRYSLPPAAGLGGPNSSTTSNTFLGASVAQVVPRSAAVGAATAEPPHYATYGAAGTSPYMPTAVPFVSAMSSLRGTPSFAAAPPPYAGGL